MSDTREAGILIVDDEPGILEVLQVVLADSGFSRVYTATSGIECLKILAREKDRVHVVIMDEVMPGLAGSATFEHLVQVHPYIVGVVFISGHIKQPQYEDIVERRRSERAFALGFCEKPFDLELLVEKVNEAVGFIMAKRKTNATPPIASIMESLAWIQSKLVEIQLDKGWPLPQEKGISRLLRDLGWEVVKIVLIGALVFLLLFFGVGDLLRAAIGIAK